jgi:NTE family protein
MADNIIQGSVKKVSDALKQAFTTPKKVGLVLGGGGARGIAHVGVLKVIVENKIPIHCIAGTSSGALFGALFSGGMSPFDMVKTAKSSGWAKLVKFRLSKTGPVSGEGIEELIIRSIGNKNIEDLRIPLCIVATDLCTGNKRMLTKGNVAKAVHASSAIPGIFSPVEFEGRTLVDGLVVENVPVETMKGMGADYIIAVDAVPDLSIEEWDPNVFSVIERALDILCRFNSVSSKALADIEINPVHRNISALSFNEVDYLIKAGEEAALAVLPKIKERLKIS